MSDKRILEDRLLSFASLKFGFNVDDLMKNGGGYQNMIYQYELESKSYILRISKASTRSLNKIRSELDFLHHLDSIGVSVSVPVKSKDLKLIEEMSDELDTYYLVAFNKASGAHITYPDYLANPKFYYDLGKVTGKIHKGSKSFPQHMNKRHDWKENYYVKHFLEHIPSEEQKKIDALRAIVVDLEMIPRDDNNFGLIHGDINVGNFFVDNNKITMFDFDECQNSWYIEDIAIQLFYTVYVMCDDSIEERKEKAIEFMQNFLRGYKTEQDVDIEMIKLIPKFLMLREMIVHVGIYRRWDFSKLSGWSEDYFRDSSKRIIDRKPIVTYDSEWHNL